MKLLLTSAGLTTLKIRSEFLRLVGKPPQETKIAFIPTAADPGMDTSFLKRLVNELKLFLDLALKEGEFVELGRVDIVDLKKHTPESLEKKLEQYDVIFVNGGNTFYLLYWAKKSGFLDLVPKLLQQGKVYVGVSAGSVLASQSICVVGWSGIDDPHVVQLEDLNGLDLVDFYIFPHYNTGWDKTIAENRHTLSGELVCLTDFQAVVVENDTHHVI